MRCRSSHTLRVVWWVMALGLIWAGAACASTAYIQSGDWQYRELDKLGQAGLLVGHPAAPISTWTDRLSRYEAAALTLRAVEGIGKAYAAQGAKLQELAQANEVSETPATVEVSPPTPAVRTEDLVRVEKLIQEFRTELVGMGEKLDELQASLKLVLGMVKDLTKKVDDIALDQKRHKLGGYVQFRFAGDQATQGRHDFFIKGARVTMQGPLGPKTSYGIEMQFDSSLPSGVSGAGPGSKAQLRTARLDYKFTDLSFFRTGQIVIPFGYELEESTPDLWTGDRSQMMDQLFPDQRDPGAFLEWRRKPNSPQFSLGVFNGPGIDLYDNNTHLNPMGRIRVGVPHGTAAISAYIGDNGTGPSATAQDRYGVGAKLTFGQTLFMAEWISGKNLGADVEGYYFQIGRPVLRNRTNLLFAKFDMYDENLEAPQELFRRWSLGYWYEFDKYSRLTLVRELRNIQPNYSLYSKFNSDATYLQFQERF